MIPGGYKIRDQASIHFMTLTVVDGVDVFTRKVYRDLLLDSVRFCQEKKGLLLHCWCLMSNHIHLIASARRNKNYQFWQQDNHPEELYSPSFVYQKINYIHHNPVEAGRVKSEK